MSTVRVEAVWALLQGKQVAQESWLGGNLCGQARHALVRHCTAICGAHPAQPWNDATIQLYNPDLGRIQHFAAAICIPEIQMYAWFDL